MATASTAAYSDGECANWEQLSEKHAKTAAKEFAKACLTHMSAHGAEASREALTYRHFMKKFVDIFTEQFEIDFCKLKVQSKLPNGSHSNAHEESDFSEDTDSPKTQPKHFFRRLSFKGLRKGKGLFHKQNSDDVELSGHSGRQTKTKLAKIVVECRKDGLVNYLTPESLEQPGGPHKWEKCRLALVKTVGGYMLEFYSPPKAAKPRSGVFCFLITEARETTALEMPDHENTFVLKADNNMEYVIEAHDTDDMKSWLATIKYCMRSAPTSQPPPGALPPTQSPATTAPVSAAAPVDPATSGTPATPSNPTVNVTGTISENNIAMPSTPAVVPDLPPRRDCVSSNSNFELCNETMAEEPSETGKISYQLVN